MNFLKTFTAGKGEDMSDAWLIVGLGTWPGVRETRHTYWSMVLTSSRKLAAASRSIPRPAVVVVEGRLGFGGSWVILMKSLGYMNTSGGPVSAVAKFYGITPDHIIIVAAR